MISANSIRPPGLRNLWRRISDKFTWSSFVLLFGLGEEFGPVGNGPCHHTGINEVELFRVSPWIFYVVDVKSDIWWCAIEKSVEERECGY
jgi:hypothetical protein